MTQRPLLWLFVLGLLCLALPVIVVAILPELPALGQLGDATSNATSYPKSTLPLRQQPLEASPELPPWITNVQIVDLDRDGLRDVIACDARFNRLIWYRQQAGGQWQPTIIASDLPAPAHATVVDLDGDDDLDVIVSVLGNIWPDDGVIGSVVFLENTPAGFEPHMLLGDVRRVADVQAGDLDGDGDLDLAVAVFGYARGEILWLENRGERRWRSHQLMAVAGTIHVPLADYDGDGDLDIAAVASQEDEEVWGFENLGGGQFAARRLFDSLNFDLGSAGLVNADLDGDGDQDLILPVGDNLEDHHSYPQPYHGCIWLENQGSWKFAAHRISNLGGTYAAAVGDLDGDGDRDVVLVSMFNDWDRPGHASIVWLENDGKQNFKTWQIDEHPTHLVTVACGDINGDGRDDIVAGAMYLVPPYDRVSGATLWLSQTGPSAAPTSAFRRAGVPTAWPEVDSHPCRRAPFVGQVSHLALSLFHTRARWESCPTAPPTDRRS